MGHDVFGLIKAVRSAVNLSTNPIDRIAAIVGVLVAESIRHGLTERALIDVVAECYKSLLATKQTRAGAER